MGDYEVLLEMPCPCGAEQEWLAIPDDEFGIFAFVRTCSTCDRTWTHVVSVSTKGYSTMFREGVVQPPSSEAELTRRAGWCDPSMDLQNLRNTLRLQDSVRRSNVRLAEKLGVAILVCECGTESDVRGTGWQMLESGTMLCPDCVAQSSTAPAGGGERPYATAASSELWSDVATLVSCISDKAADPLKRSAAIREAVEVFAPDASDDRSRSEEEQLLIDAITAVACDRSQHGHLLNEAGDALGLSWIWRGAFDDKTYAQMAEAAQYSARRVFGQAFEDWVPPAAS